MSQKAIRLPSSMEFPTAQSQYDIPPWMNIIAEMESVVGPQHYICKVTEAKAVLNFRRGQLTV